MTKNLNGLRILNTRPATQGLEFKEKITNLNGISIEYPLLEIIEKSDWIDDLPELNRIDQALFISPNAVNFFFSRLKKACITWPSEIQVTTIGQASRKNLQHFEISSISTPLIADSEHLLELTQLKLIKNQSIILVKGKNGRPLIEQVLLERQAKLFTIEVYERNFAKINPQFTQSLWRDDCVDIILLTCEQSIRYLFNLFANKEALIWLRRKPCLVISKRLEQLALKLGIKQVICCHPSQMIDALIKYATED